MDNSFLIVGLGNPGARYNNTWHNFGFAVVDRLLHRWKISGSKKKFDGEVFEHLVDGRKAILLKPQTFMNLSGNSVAQASQFLKIPFENILVVSDDLDLPKGVLRLRMKGGAGGHNGLKSLIEKLGSEEFPRVRIGIGRDAVIPADEYVLRPLSVEDRAVFESGVDRAADAVEVFLKEGIAKAMNIFNKRGEEDGA